MNRTQINGVSTAQSGEENYDCFYSACLKKQLVQYDYRHTDGRLFSCVAPTLERARQKRDIWLNDNSKK